MKHIKTIYTGAERKQVEETGGTEPFGCGECQTSCQSACKTSCTVANQVCAQVK